MLPDHPFVGGDSEWTAVPLPHPPFILFCGACMYTYDDVIPRTDERIVRPPDGEFELVEEMDDRIREALLISSDWISSAHISERYYRSDQYRQRVNARDRMRIRLVANFIRRDVDLIVSEVLDGKPIVNPTGRHPKYYELGRQLMQILEWSREEEENWDSDLEAVITSCVHIGEGILFEGWDQDEDRGRGRPVALQLDARYVFWDEAAREIQKDDAQWIVWIQHEPINLVETRWPKLEGKLQPETFETFLVPDRSRYSDQLAGGRSTSMPTPMGPINHKNEKVWVKREWYKKLFYEKSYFYSDNGEKATVFMDNEGEQQEVALDASLYGQLPPEEQEQVLSRRRRRVELWEAVAINENLVVHRLSPFDESKGGHGKYPFAFFSYEIIPDEPRARGEISFLLSMQDITNETVTQVLEQLFLNNVGYWHVYKGSLTPEEREKFNRLFYEPHQVVESMQGVSPPEHRGLSPGGLQAAMSVLPAISGLADKVSGIQDVDRGQVPGNIQSGRAIRALQAKQSRLNIKVKRHIESGLRRASYLRMYNIMQLMRGPRILEITDPKSNEGKLLYLGHDEMEIISYYDLKPGQTPEGQPSWMNPEGIPVEMMVLNEDMRDDVIFEKVKLVLDTGQEANRLERMDQAEMVLNTVGPAAIPWAAKLLEWPNADDLIAAIEKRDEAMQMMTMGEEFQQKTGMTIQQALEMVTSLMQGGGVGGAPAEGAPAAGGVPAAPPGPPVPQAGVPPAMPSGALPPIPPGANAPPAAAVAA